jgi:hypothetical protein
MRYIMNKTLRMYQEPDTSFRLPEILALRLRMFFPQ